MPILDGIIEDIDNGENPMPPNSQFRIWLTSMPSDKFPVSILQMTDEFEAFKGLDENIEKNLNEWERIYNLQKP